MYSTQTISMLFRPQRFFSLPRSIEYYYYPSYRNDSANYVKNIGDLSFKEKTPEQSHDYKDSSISRINSMEIRRLERWNYAIQK